MRKRRTMMALAAWLAAAMCVSCLDVAEVPEGERVCVSATATKGAPVVAVPDAFGVWGYVWKTEAALGRPNWMCGETFTRDGAVWRSTLRHGNIPQGYMMRLWALCPVDAAGLSSLPMAATSGFPAFDYECPSAVSSQNDILVAWGDTYLVQPAAFPLRFRHATSCVLFKTAADRAPSATIRSISLTHAASSGHFAESADPDAERWSSVTGDATYTIYPNRAIASTDIDVQVHADDECMMLVPQVLPAGSEVVVSYEDAGGVHTLSASLAGTELPMGYKVVVRLLFPEGGRLAVEVSVLPWESGDEHSRYLDDDWVYGISATQPDTFPWDGGAASTVVDAYRERDGVREAVPWKAQVETAPGVWEDMTEGSRPWWLASFPLSSRSGAAPLGEAYAYAAAPNRVTTHEEILRRHAVEGRVDLSTRDFVTGADGPRATANSYVVSGPGRYCIPVVYGCAVDELCFGASGLDRTPSYNPSGSYADYLDKFRTHVRNAFEYAAWGESAMRIQGPWICAQTTFGTNITAAQVVWDRFNNGEHCVTVEGLRDDGGQMMLDFSVDAATVSPGCAVVAVMDTNLGVVAWSWLIWIQPEDLSPRGVYDGAGMRYLQRYDLGWTDTSEGLHYEPVQRRLRLRLTEGPEQYAYLDLAWDGHDMESTQGWAPRFQWGRKDALPPDAAVESSEAHMAYWSIRNPSTFITYRHLVLTTYWYDWSQNDYRNLWNAFNTQYAKSTDSPVKTVYDPCPRGYAVAHGTAFDRLAEASWTDLGNGTRGYAAAGGTLLLHSTGYTDRTGAATGAGTAGLWWTDSPSHMSHRTSFALRVDGATAAVDDGVERATGASVRCVRHALAPSR